MGIRTEIREETVPRVQVTMTTWTKALTGAIPRIGPLDLVNNYLCTELPTKCTMTTEEVQVSGRRLNSV